MNPDLLFFCEKEPGALQLYQVLEARLKALLPEMGVKVGKSQISFTLHRQFGCASLLKVGRAAQRPHPYLTVTFGLDHPVESPRIAGKTEPYPRRWTHHVLVGTPEEVDAELLDWLQEAAWFSASKR